MSHVVATHKVSYENDKRDSDESRRLQQLKIHGPCNSATRAEFVSYIATPLDIAVDDHLEAFVSLEPGAAAAGPAAGERICPVLAVDAVAPDGTVR